MINSIAIISLLAAVTSAAPLESAPLAPRVDYIQFHGDGSTAAGWPSTHDWHTWDHLWTLNAGIMAESCGFNNWGANDSPAEIEAIRVAIRNIAGQNNLDDRFVLAIVMEESQGCVRVPTTVSPDGRVKNPGLMQSHNGQGTCAGVANCPASEINQMIHDGVVGTSSGAGVVGTIASTGESNAQKYYAGARVYNSGRFDRSDLSQAFGANPQYASDIANRLLGWHN